MQRRQLAYFSMISEMLQMYKGSSPSLPFMAIFRITSIASRGLSTIWKMFDSSFMIAEFLQIYDLFYCLSELTETRIFEEKRKNTYEMSLKCNTSYLQDSDKWKRDRMFANEISTNRFNLLTERVKFLINILLLLL